MEKTNLDYMSLAFDEAKKAYEKNEVPVGAIIVYKDTIIASSYNQKFEKKDTLAHAEIIAIQEAQIYLKTWRLNDCSLYVTLEPCPMCAGAIIQSRISNVFYGAKNNAYGSFGTVVSLEKLFPDSKNLTIVSGIMEEESSKLMKDFFRRKLQN